MESTRNLKISHSVNLYHKPKPYPQDLHLSSAGHTQLLCQECNSITVNELLQRYSNIKHRPAKLIQTEYEAENGCPLCKLLWAGFLNDPWQKGRPVDFQSSAELTHHNPESNLHAHVPKLRTISATLYLSSEGGKTVLHSGSLQISSARGE